MSWGVVSRGTCSWVGRSHCVWAVSATDVEFVRMQRKWPWPALNEGVLMINGLTNHPFSAFNRLFLAAVGARLPVPDVV